MLNFKSTMTDLKLYLINGTSLMVSLMSIDAYLKITLLLLTIGYTIHKWYIMGKTNKK
jgi:sRNA-binding regulator protein Hfq|tara:strand:+ start:1407 stop:1580 length:174 start_codon:yes stop_codon:yes gene_type:complete